MWCGLQSGPAGLPRCVAERFRAGPELEQDPARAGHVVPGDGFHRLAPGQLATQLALLDQK